MLRPAIFDLQSLDAHRPVSVSWGLVRGEPLRHACTVQDRGPFLYVCVLAVHPEHQGQGLGSVLLRHMLDRADALGRWAYLEATTERNRQLYLRSVRQTRCTCARVCACVGGRGEGGGVA